MIYKIYILIGRFLLKWNLFNFYSLNTTCQRISYNINTFLSCQQNFLCSSFVRPYVCLLILFHTVNMCVQFLLNLLSGVIHPWFVGLHIFYFVIFLSDIVLYILFLNSRSHRIIFWSGISYAPVNFHCSIYLSNESYVRVTPEKDLTYVILSEVFLNFITITL